MNPIDPRPVPRIRETRTIGPMSLAITWADGLEDAVDLSGWIGAGGTALAPLTEPSLFATAAIVEHGGAVQWGDDEDLAIDSAHIEALVEQQQPFGEAELNAWMVELGVSNQEAADMIGVGLSTWHTYKSGTAAIPRGVQIACRALARDKVMFEANYRPRRNGRPPRAA